jgi:hypothetical protein
MNNVVLLSLQNLAGSPGPALQFIGNGSENTALYQNVNLFPSTSYGISFWMATFGTVTTGVMEFSIVSNNNVVTLNNAGNNNLFTISHSALSSTYAPFFGFFQTPKLLPASTRLRIRASTAINSGGRILIQTLALIPSTLLYNGGPYVALFSGLKELIKGDNFTININNSYNGLLQSFCNRVFAMGGLNLTIPSTSGSPTIPDSLVPTPPPSPTPPPPP